MQEFDGILLRWLMAQFLVVASLVVLQAAKPSKEMETFS
jgi:hypothetical protein